MNQGINSSEISENPKISHNLIQISVFLNETTWKSFKIPSDSTVSELKQSICDSEDLDSSKYRVRIIEENSGITAFRQLTESVLISKSGILGGSKLSLDKTIKRVVRFVESDEEQDKVVEISTKHKSSTVPSTSCLSDSRDLSEVECEPKKEKKLVTLRIKKLGRILKNLREIEYKLNFGFLSTV